MTVLKSLFSTEGFSLARALRSFSRASEQRTCKKYSSKKRLALMAMVDTLRTFVFSLQTLPKYLFHTLDKKTQNKFFELWAKSKGFSEKDEEFLCQREKDYWMPRASVTRKCPISRLGGCFTCCGLGRADYDASSVNSRATMTTSCF